jgi:hypothetical protein
MRRKWKRILTGLLVGCLLITGLSVLSCQGEEAEEAVTPEESQYVELWQQVSTALVEFSFAEFEASQEAEEPSLVQLATLYREKRDAFQTSLASLEGATPPPDFTGFHTEIIPLYQEILESMDLMVNAARQEDEAALLEARAGFIDAMEEAAAVLQQSQP